MSRVLQIASADGWRIVRPVLGNCADDLEAQPDDGLFYVTPVACFALVQGDDLNTPASVVPIVPDDWPHYLWPIGANADEPDQVLAYLGPGEEPGADHREAAIHEIRRFREKRQG